jgi:hypothetical protein
LYPIISAGPDRALFSMFSNPESERISFISL